MIFTGTAAELAELTRKHWGAEWWPKRGITVEISLSTDTLRGELIWGYSCNGGGVFALVDARDAASIIFSAAMVWLAENARTVELVQTKNQRTPWRVYLRGATHAVDGPSPLHAVLAAVEVVG